MNTSTTFSFEQVKLDIQARFNPLPGLTPQGLTQQIDGFRAGNLRHLALTMDAIEERDDLLASVVPKAKAAPTVHGWEINVMDTVSEGEKEKAEKQKEALEFFYNNLRTTSAVEQDLIGGTNVLLEQMMDAKGKRYSVHNIVWKAENRGLYSAKFWHVPLWFFESRTGKLRFLDTPGKYDGTDMKDGAWLKTVGRGLMIACSVAWMYKHLPLRDWLVYCRRHGLPGFEGVTDAQPGTPEYVKLTEAVRAAAAGEFAWVRSMNQQINKVDFGAEGELPFPALVDRMDRAMSAIWRGGDLSTMSKDQQAVGAQGQADESEIIEVKDANWLSEQCNFNIDRQVIDYAFGTGEPLLACFKVKTAQKQDITTDLSIDKFALANGHPVSKKQFAERYNRPEPDAEDELLTAPQAQPAGDPTTKAINEATLATVGRAVQADLLPASKRIVGLLALNDGGAFRAQAQALRRALPGLMGSAATGASTEIEEILAGSFLAGVLGGTVPAINSFNNDEQRDGQGRWSDLSGAGAARVFTHEEMKTAINSALANTVKGVQSSHSLGRVPEALATRINRQLGGDRDFAGKEIRIDSDFIRHARAYHPNLTDDDFHRIPELFDTPDEIVASETNRHLPAVVFSRKIESRDYLLVGAQLNGKGQVQLTTLKKSSTK